MEPMLVLLAQPVATLSSLAQVVGPVVASQPVLQQLPVALVEHQ